MNKKADCLSFYLKDLIEQIEQFPEVSKGINTSYAKEALQWASKGE